MIGSLLTNASTPKKAQINTPLVTNSPQLIGFPQGSSSDPFNVTATKRLPTPNTRVRDPSQSIRASFSRSVCGLYGSLMSTKIQTRMNERHNSGI